MIKLIKKCISILRFGKVRLVIKATEANVPSEYEILDRNNKVVGYWAFGIYDPNMPYKGEQEYAQLD